MMKLWNITNNVNAIFWHLENFHLKKKSPELNSSDILIWILTAFLCVPANIKVNNLPRYVQENGLYLSMGLWHHRMPLIILACK